MAEVVQDWPPNISEIRKVLPVTRNNIFAYGGKIYSPSTGSLPPELHAHEAVHFRQQDDHPGGVEGWWEDFLADPKFRLDQEVPAHRAEYRYLLDHAESRQRRRYIQKKGLKELARRLSAPMYGGIISQKKAMELISE